MLLLAVAVHWHYLQDGGFYGDDWDSAHRYELARALPGSAFSTSFEALEARLGARPLEVAAITVSHGLFGLHFGAYSALGLAIAVLVAALFFLLLLAVGVSPVFAWIPAALTLVFPYSDSVRLWATDSATNIATAFALAGALIALRGLSLRGRRAVLVHGVSVACYVSSVLTYESAATVMLLSGLLYRVRADWLRVRIRWAVDATAVLAAVAWSYSQTHGLRPTATPSIYLRDSITFAHQEVQLVARTLVPVNVSDLVRFVVVAVVIAAAMRAFRTERRFLLLAAAAALVLVATCVPFIGSGLHPLDSGEYNRVNIVGALPLAALALGLVLAVTRATSGGLHAWAGVALLVLLGAQYARLTQQDINLWIAASDDQSQVLANLQRALPDPRPGTVVYSFGAPAATHPGVFVFSSDVDLQGAVNVGIWRGRGAIAYPVTQPTRMVCGPHTVIPFSAPNVYNSATAGFGPDQAGRYGRVVFINAATSLTRRVFDRASCRAALARAFAPGPLVGRL